MDKERSSKSWKAQKNLLSLQQSRTHETDVKVTLTEIAPTEVDILA